MTPRIASTSSVAHSPRLHPDRRSIAVTTGENTATLKTETKSTSRASAIDTNAQATARIVRIEIETTTSRRPASAAPGDDSAAVTCASCTARSIGAPAMTCHHANSVIERPAATLVWAR